MTKDLEGRALKMLVVNQATIEFEDLLKLQFNDLKQAEGRDVTKLVEAMTDEGFLSPFYIWPREDEPDYVIDGAGRRKALLAIRERGMSIPALPWIQVQAEDLPTAKRYVLMIESKHGRVTQESFDAFTADIEWELPQLKHFELPEMQTGDVSIDEKVWELSPKEVTSVTTHERRTTKDPTKESAEEEPEEIAKKTVQVTCPKCENKFKI